MRNGDITCSPAGRCWDGNGRSGSVVLNPSGLDQMKCSHLRNRLSARLRTAAPIAKRFRGHATTGTMGRVGVIRVAIVSFLTKSPSGELRLDATEVATPSCRTVHTGLPHGNAARCCKEIHAALQSLDANPYPHQQCQLLIAHSPGCWSSASGRGDERPSPAVKRSPPMPTTPANTCLSVGGHSIASCAVCASLDQTMTSCAPSICPSFRYASNLHQLF
uniref:Uncharacterized protein n=1 Tax=Plectus sambesii TaxID=2011161 RepID=A0A914XVX2_9BILA